MNSRLALASLLALCVAAPVAAPVAAYTPAAGRLAPCANIARTACTLKGSYSFTDADGALHRISGNLVVKQTKKKIITAGLVRHVQESLLPAVDDQLDFRVVSLSSREGCEPAAGATETVLLTADNVGWTLEDTALDTDTTADEASYKVKPKKATTLNAAAFAAAVREAGAKRAEILLVVRRDDELVGCAVLATRR